MSDHLYYYKFKVNGIPDDQYINGPFADEQSARDHIIYYKETFSKYHNISEFGEPYQDDDMPQFGHFFDRVLPEMLSAGLESHEIFRKTLKYLMNKESCLPFVQDNEKSDKMLNEILDFYYKKSGLNTHIDNKCKRCPLGSVWIDLMDNEPDDYDYNDVPYVKFENE